MNFSQTIFLSNNGLFDFDFTFIGEAILFFLFSLVVTFFFLKPISVQVNNRSKLINSLIKKSIIILDLGYENLLISTDIFTKELSELTRQVKITKNFSASIFELELNLIDDEIQNIIQLAVKNLLIKSTFSFKLLIPNINKLSNYFFNSNFIKI